jgi:TrmH family RNA methyltransferase
MVTKSLIKRISSLHQKKHRISDGLFIAEGIKVVQEFLHAGFECEQLLITPEWKTQFDEKSYIEADKNTFKKISCLVNPSGVLGVFKIPQPSQAVHKGLTVVLDDVNDPGNLGTIIRLCDWFGVKQLVCSPETVDCFNPKVVQAAMGSLARIEVIYMPLDSFLEESNRFRPSFGTFMDGKSVYRQSFTPDAVLVMGNEANGIRPETEKLVQHRIGIPRFGALQQTESLNVATATAIFLSEMNRDFTEK